MLVLACCINTELPFLSQYNTDGHICRFTVIEIGAKYDAKNHRVACEPKGGFALVVCLIKHNVFSNFSVLFFPIFFFFGFCLTSCL